MGCAPPCFTARAAGTGIEQRRPGFLWQARTLSPERLSGMDFYCSSGPFRWPGDPDALDRVFDSISASMTTSIDMPAIINAAYRRGVRVFVDCGPRDQYRACIKRILKDRPHLVVSLSVPRKDLVQSTFEAARDLIRHGVAVSETGFARLSALAYRSGPAETRHSTASDTTRAA